MTIAYPARREALRMAFAAGTLSVGGLRGGPAMARTEWDRRADAGLHDPPAVWLEEYWDVKPGALPKFLAAYDTTLHALARQTPGYRGYTVLTSTAKDPLAEAAVDWDALLGRGYNVLIIHHIQTWPDADDFRARIAALHDNARPEISLADHLARALFPHANSYRDAEYRMVAAARQARPAVESGADGQQFIAERWHIRPEYLKPWLADYQAFIDTAARGDRGYLGYSVATSLPPQALEAGAAKMTSASRGRLGANDALYINNPGVMIEGTLRTDVSINAAALYKDIHNIIVMHELQSGEDVGMWRRRLARGHADEHTGAGFTGRWSGRLINDAVEYQKSVFRMVKSTFIVNS